MKRRNSTQGKNPWADHYTEKARQDNYPARSVYKLMEIQKKHAILKKGQRVLDLGCAPGSWLKYAAEVIGPSGKVVGVDLKPVVISLPPCAQTLTGDMLEMDQALIQAVDGRYDVVLSDMAPATTGLKGVDEARSFNLCEAALDLAGAVLVPGGSFICKIFQGPDFETFLRRVKASFRACKLLRPQSTRKASKEIYIVAFEKK